MIYRSYKLFGPPCIFFTVNGTSQEVGVVGFYYSSGSIIDCRRG